MTTLSVITGCWGKDYAAFADQWWRGVLSLNRKPDEIIFGIEEGDPENLLETIPAGVEATVLTFPTEGINYRYDHLILNSTSKWFSFVPIDDELLPEAFDEIDQADESGAELYVDSIVYRNTGRVWKGHWNYENIRYVMPAPQLIPSTKELYERLGMKFDYRWSDWIFQIDAAKANAKPYIASTCRLIFDEGLTRLTESGRMLDPAIRHAEDVKVHRYAMDNGF
jgi:hypothetical protein